MLARNTVKTFVENDQSQRKHVHAKRSLPLKIGIGVWEQQLSKNRSYNNSNVICVEGRLEQFWVPKHHAV